MNRLPRAALLLALTALLFLIPCASSAQEAALTLMIYLTGSDLETQAGAASRDLEEMLSHLPVTGEINLVVMASGAKEWQSEIAEDETSIYASSGGALNKVHTGALRSMGDPQTLRALLEYGHSNYPANRYALILWDHGAGPMMGICFDELFSGEEGMDALTLSELRQALSGSPFASEPLEWIGFDACLMASLETAHAIAPYARYMIASQDTEPASGWSYAFLEDAAGDASGADTGRRIVDAYHESLADSLACVTLSCVDLSRIPAVVEGMDALFSSLDGALDDERYHRLAACRVGTKAVACSSVYEYDLVDLADLLDMYEAEGLADCSALHALLEQAVICNRSNTDFLYGLNIYNPHHNDAQYTALAGRYAQLGFSSGYASFITGMSEIRMGDALTEWGGAMAVESALREGETHLAMQLSPEQAEHFAYGSLFIFEFIGGQYYLTYYSDETTLSENGQLQSVYRGESMYIVGEDGKPLTSSILYYKEDGVYELPAVLFRVTGDYSVDSLAVRLLYREDAQGNLSLMQAQPVGSGAIDFGKSSVDLSEWMEIQFVNSGYFPAYDASSVPLPIAQWETGYVSLSILGDMTQVWRPALLNLQDSESRFALLRVTDTQNRRQFSPFIPLVNPNTTQLAVAEQLLAQNEHCSLTLTGAQLIAGIDPVFRLTLLCENAHDAPLQLYPRDCRADGICVSDAASQHQVQPGQSGVLHIDLRAADLQAASVVKASSFSFSLEGRIDYGETLFTLPISCSIPVDFAPILAALDS